MNYNNYTLLRKLNEPLRKRKMRSFSRKCAKNKCAHRYPMKTRRGRKVDNGNKYAKVAPTKSELLAIQCKTSETIIKSRIQKIKKSIDWLNKLTKTYYIVKLSVICRFTSSMYWFTSKYL